MKVYISRIGNREFLCIQKHELTSVPVDSIKTIEHLSLEKTLLIKTSSITIPLFDDDIAKFTSWMESNLVIR